MGGVLFIDERTTSTGPRTSATTDRRPWNPAAGHENQREIWWYPGGLQGSHGHLLPLQSRAELAHRASSGFPDYAPAELLRIADKLLEQQNYSFAPGARDV